MALRYKEWIRRSHTFWHLVFFSLVLVVIYVVVRGLGTVLTPVAAALVLSYLLDPVVCWMERRFRFPRWLGTLILFLVALLLLTALVLLVLPVIARELHAFAEAVPGYLQRIRDTVVPWVQNTFSVQMPTSIHDLVNQLGANMKAVATTALSPLGGVAGKVAKQTAGFFSALGTLLLIPIFTFYFLPKFPGIVKGAQELIPRRYVGWVRETALEIDRVLASWIRGQLTVIAVLAVLYSVGLSIVGIKMAVLIGLLTAMLAFIPYVGVVIGLTLALLVCLLEYTGPGQMLGVGVVFAVVQVTDGLLLTPQIVGEKTGLGPVGVLLALMVGGALFGFVGVLLAVPVAAALVVVLKRALRAYKSSLYYQKGAETTATSGADRSA
jgi:predicted PurR-regulated permease PerM